MRTIVVRPNKDQTTALCLDTIQRNKQALVFCSSKRAAESQAEKLAKNILLEEQHINFSATKRLSEKLLHVLTTPTKQCKRLAQCVEKGVAFHHAGLASKQRELLEDAFREGLLRIICSTPTLAAGLDLPAFRTIIRDTKRFGNRGMVAIPVLEYEQMAGRAGRPGKEAYGEAIIVAKEEKQIKELTKTYLHGTVEDILSKLAVEPVLRTYILSLTATGFIQNKTSLYMFFDKTFYAHQFGDTLRLQQTLDKMVFLLQEWEFLEHTAKATKETDFTTKAMFTTGTQLLHKKETTSQEELTATLLGRRVSELYVDPLTAHVLLKGLEKLFKKTTATTIAIQGNVTFAVVHLLTCSLEMIPLLRTKASDMNRIQSLRAQQEFILSEEEFYEVSVDDFDDTIKTTQCLVDWMNEETEDRLLEKYAIRPGELSIKLQKADWLLYACEELSRIKNYKSIIKIIKQTRVRLKNGVKKELLPLLHFKNIGRVRARKLYNHQIKNIADVEHTTIELLSGIIGTKLATNLKEQVGQKTKEGSGEKQATL